MRWITRQNVKVDRVACPWLIKRFIDPQAEFLFVREEELLERARQEEAIPFDATRFSEVKLNHRGERCTFEAILERLQAGRSGAAPSWTDRQKRGRPRARRSLPREPGIMGYRAGICPFRG
jgi:hypothetical protein